MIKNKNSYSNPEQNSASLLRRLYIYQKERFPIVGHGLLVGSFSFSAIAYSRISRGIDNFVEWDIFLIGIFITITLFLLLRIFDEFKDADDDARFRKELPVPRGLVSLHELKVIGIIITILQVAVILFFIPKMIVLYSIVIFYLLLMGKEFFVAEWLKKRQFWYVTSHMFIIPLIDIFASGLDWHLAGVSAPIGLIFFFAVSYMNGIVLEVGRKIKPKEFESEGVLTYTAMLGTKNAVWIWLALLFSTLILSIIAAQYAGYGMMAAIILGAIFILCSLPAVFFLYKPNIKSSKYIEYSSAFWTISMYLSLGGIPMIQKILQYG